MSFDRPLRIGTRGSELAVTQSQWVADRLAEAGAPAELVIIKTSGDRIQDRPLAEIGGKGLFIKEIEAALLDESIDLAVHSMKDMPAEMHPLLRVGAIPKRADARDTLIVNDPAIKSLDDLPEGALVATGSTRRKAILSHRRPDLKFMPLRGNVGTRLQRLRDEHDGMVATLLAAAGLERLGISPEGGIPLEPEVMLPAVGQGALCVQARADSFELEEPLIAIHDTHTATCVAAEREFLERLGGDCTTPIAAYGVLDGHELRFRAIVAGEGGSPWFEAELRSPSAYARRTGGALAERLLREGAEQVLRG